VIVPNPKWCTCTCSRESSSTTCITIIDTTSNDKNSNKKTPPQPSTSSVVEEEDDTKEAPEKKMEEKTTVDVDLSATFPNAPSGIAKLRVKLRGLKLLSKGSYNELMDRFKQ
jgi:hypothetical protein